MAKEPKDILNPCGHKNSERAEALKKLPSSICPACLIELQAELEQHRWIPVNEEMPSQVPGHWGSEMVFATDGKQVWACKYNFSAEYWTAPSGDITHWKPIIQP